MKKKEIIHNNEKNHTNVNLIKKLQILTFKVVLFSTHKLFEDIFLCIQQCTPNTNTQPQPIKNNSQYNMLTLRKTILKLNNNQQ